MNGLTTISRKKSKDLFETNENENTATQRSVAHGESGPEEDIHSITGLPQETRNISHKQSNLIFKGSRKKNNEQSPKLVEERT